MHNVSFNGVCVGVPHIPSILSGAVSILNVRDPVRATRNEGWHRIGVEKSTKHEIEEHLEDFWQAA